MNEDQVITKLRGAAAAVPPATTANVAAVAAGGRRLRRRRQSMQLLGSGLGVAVVLAAGITTVSALNEGDGRSTVTAAGDPTAKPHPAAGGSAATSSEQTLANLQLLATALGPDFRVNPEGRLAGDSTTDSKAPGYPVVEVIPGSSTAERLPTGYRMTATGGVPSYNLTLQERCKPVVEKGTRTSACTPVKSSDGRTVQVQEFRNEFGKLATSTGKLMDGAGTAAYLPRVDGSFVMATLNINAAGATVTKASHDSAEALVDDFRDALVAFAADPKVGPAPGPANGEPAFENTPPKAHEQNQGYLQEALGSPTWGLYDGVVTLENNKGKYKDLPSDFFAGTASVESVTQAQFDAACKEKPGFNGCSTKTLEDGRKVYTLRWADRDAARDDLRGESSAYFVRPDGTIAVATISLAATQVTEENRDEQVNGTLAWLDSFQDELIAAATDPRMTFGD